mgnify:CR=1 FL=1
MASLLKKLGTVTQYYGLLMDILAALDSLRDDVDSEAGGVFHIKGVKYGGRSYSLFFTVRRER